MSNLIYLFDLDSNFQFNLGYNMDKQLPGNDLDREKFLTQVSNYFSSIK